MLDRQSFSGATYRTAVPALQSFSSHEFRQAHGKWFLIACMVWIDESSIYSNPMATRYGPDKEAWNDTALSFRRDHATIVKLGVIQPINPEIGIEELTPLGNEVEVPLLSVNRPPTLQNNIEMWKRLTDNGRTGVEVPNLRWAAVLLVDSSTSMVRDDIQPGFDEFVTWLKARSNAPVTVVDEDFNHERWYHAPQFQFAELATAGRP